MRLTSRLFVPDIMGMSRVGTERSIKRLGAPQDISYSTMDSIVTSGHLIVVTSRTVIVTSMIITRFMIEKLSISSAGSYIKQKPVW